MSYICSNKPGYKKGGVAKLDLLVAVIRRRSQSKCLKSVAAENGQLSLPHSIEFGHRRNFHSPWKGQDTAFSHLTNIQLLARLDPRKSMGPDGMHPRFIYEAKEALTKPLTKLFTKSIHKTIWIPPMKVNTFTAPYGTHTPYGMRWMYCIWISKKPSTRSHTEDFWMS